MQKKDLKYIASPISKCDPQTQWPNGKNINLEKE